MVGIDLGTFEAFVFDLDGVITRPAAGVRSFLASRGIEAPRGTPGAAAGQETLYGLVRRKDRYFLQLGAGHRAPPRRAPDALHRPDSPAHVPPAGRRRRGRARHGGPARPERGRGASPAATPRAARSDERSAFAGMFCNRWLWGAILTSLALQTAVIYVPFLQRAFATVSLTAGDWLRCAVVGSSVLWLGELSKMAMRPGPAGAATTRNR